MRIYFTLFNFYAWNFGAFYSTKYRRLYVQLIPCVLCMVVVIGRRRLVNDNPYLPAGCTNSPSKLLNSSEISLEIFHR